MKNVLRRRPSPAMIVGIVALVLALGGTAVAGGVLTTKKFKNQAVRGPVSYSTSTVAVPNTGFGGAGFEVSVGCPAGTHVVGGGLKVSNDDTMFVNDSYPTTAGWHGTVFAGTAGGTATITAICAISKNVSGAPPAA